MPTELQRRGLDIVRDVLMRSRVQGESSSYVTVDDVRDEIGKMGLTDNMRCAMLCWLLTGRTVENDERSRAIEALDDAIAKLAFEAEGHVGS